MIHDLLFLQYARNHDLTEGQLLTEALVVFSKDHGEPIPDRMTPDLIDQAKRHFLNKLQTFKMDLTNPGCVPLGKPTRTGRVINE